MASYQRGNEIRVVEQRGTTIWWWSGPAGTEGTLTSVELRSEMAASEQFDVQGFELESDGWKLLDHARPIIGRVLPNPGARARSFTCVPAAVGELAYDRIELGGSLRAAIDAFLDTLAMPTTHPLATIALDVAADVSVVRLVAGYSTSCEHATGESGCCCYERQAFEIDLELEPQSRTDLDQEIGIHVALDGIAGYSAERLVAIFRHDLERIACWSRIADGEVLDISIETNEQWTPDGQTYIPPRVDAD
jgi:hypothetical protein